MRPRLLITGIAEGLGASLAATFAAAGYDILGLARSDKAAGFVDNLVTAAGGTYTHIAADLTQPAKLAAELTPHVRGRHLAPIEIMIHNAQALPIKPFAETDAAEFETVWRVVCLGAMTVAQQVLPAMLAAGKGAILLSGATASLHGNVKFAAFASAKFALRGLAQSLAREYGPAGIHVCHVVIDGLIDTAKSDQRFGPAQVKRMDPDAVARAYLNLVRQEPTVRTHELDLRPPASG